MWIREHQDVVLCVELFSKQWFHVITIQAKLFYCMGIGVEFLTAEIVVVPPPYLDTLRSFDNLPETN